MIIDIIIIVIDWYLHNRIKTGGAIVFLLVFVAVVLREIDSLSSCLFVLKTSV
jgi:hypothetical protein